MKRVIILQIVLLAGVSAAAADPNLVGWWRFDEGTGTVAADSVGGHNGTIYGATWAAGHIGGALQFDGIFNFVTVPSAPELNITGDITIAAWVNFYEAGLGFDDSEKAIVTKCINNGAYNNPYDFRSNTSIEPALAMIRANSFMHEVTYSDKYMSLNSWHHVLVRVENMVTDFYVDGVLTGKFGGGPPLTTPPTGNNYPLLIGARDDGLFFNGLIDDVRIYNRALSPDEIQRLYEGPTLEALVITGPNEVAEKSTASYKAIAQYDDGTTKDVTALAEWRVEPNSAADINAGLLAAGELLYPKQKAAIYAEYAENKVTADAQKQISIFAVCPQGNALKFDGVNDYVDVADSASLRFTQNSSFSICLWVNPSSTGYFLSKMRGHEQRSVFGYRASWNSGMNYFSFVIDQSYIMNTIVSTPIGSAPAGSWYHVAYIYDKKNMKIFLDGQLSATGVFTGNTGNTSPDKNLALGTSSVDSILEMFFGGTLDDVHIYNRILSADEIQAIMHLKPIGPDPNMVAYWDFDTGSGQIAADVSGHGNDGVLGSSTGIDAADPCWVESDAPVGRCTTEQVVGRNIFGATDDKKAANLLIADAKAKEQASLDLIDELTGANQQAKAHIHVALVQEETVSREIDATIKRLEEALRLLDYVVDSNSEPPVPSGEKDKSFPVGPSGLGTKSGEKK